MGAEEDKQELIAKLKALCLKRYGKEDAWPELFSSYDGNKDEHIDHDELVTLLDDAEIGNAFSRGHWATGIMQQINPDQSVTALSRAQVEAAFREMTPPQTRPKLTRDEAKLIGRLAATAPGAVNLDAFDNDEVAMIEEENIKYTTGQTTLREPLPYVDKDEKGQPIKPKGESGGGVVSQIAIGVVVAIIAAKVMQASR